MKKLLSGLLCLAMLMGTLCIPAYAADLKSFSDVPNNHWAYTPIMKMVERGMFAGTTTPDANGVGTFSPDSTMTRAQFVTVVTRYLYDADLKAIADEHKGSGVWYSANYEVAVDRGLITEAEFSIDAMNKPMTRQEMAMVLVRAAEVKGEVAEKLIPTQRIADYSTVGSYYKEYVRECYSMGMICGTDAKGTFAPMGTLTRAQAATVLYRLVAPETRQAVDFSVPNTQQTASTMSIYEGQNTMRPAKAGDIFVKKDGTKVVLKVGPIVDDTCLPYSSHIEKQMRAVASAFTWFWDIYCIGFFRAVAINAAPKMQVGQCKRERISMMALHALTAS